MSFGQVGYRPDEPALSSEQYNMLLQSNPNFQDRFEMQRNEDNAIAYDILSKNSSAYDMQLPLDGSVSNDMMKMGNGAQGGFILPLIMKMFGMGGKVKKGGFLQALIPFAPLIASVLPSLIDGIKGIFGKGEMDGEGMGGMLQEFIEQNKGTIKQAEDEIKMSNPKDAWRKLLGTSKDIVISILEQSPLAEQGERVINEMADKIVSRIAPKGFLKVLPTKKSGKGLGRPLNNADLAEPIIRYSLNKMVGDPAVAKKVMQQMKPQLRAGAGIYARGGLNWGSIMNIAKQGLKFALPFISQITGKLVDTNAKPVIKGLLNKFGVKNEGMQDIIANIGSYALKKGTEVGLNKLSGKGAYIDSNGKLVPNQFMVNEWNKRNKKPMLIGLPNPNAGKSIRMPDAGFVSPPSARGFTAPPQKSRGGAKKKVPLTVKLL